MNDIIEQPLVSIIIPTYNVEKYIVQTIDSILSQEFHTNFEIIIIDDNSTDNTNNLIRKYVTSDSRIKSHKNRRRKGVSGARNTGIEIATGDWIIFLDGDDLWDSKILKTQLNVLSQFPAAKLISSDFYILDENNNLSLNTEVDQDYKKYFLEANKSGNLLKLDSPILCFLKDKVVTRTGILLIKKELIEQVGFFDEELELWEDQIFWLQLAVYVDYMIYIPKPLMTYRHRAGSLTRSGVPGTIWAVIAFKKLLQLKDN